MDSCAHLHVEVAAQPFQEEDVVGHDVRVRQAAVRHATLGLALRTLVGRVAVHVEARILPT